MRQEQKRLIQNKYEIVSKIKQGGFGIVYKGYDHVFEKPVAIKAIEPGLLREAKYIDLFLEEAKNAGKLSHNNIVHIYNLVRDENGHFFIIMEYVDGLDLGKILRACKKKNMLLPQELSIFIVKEICKALEYAHNKRDLMTDKPLRLVHQDISPSNIMASLSGHVKLIDFGLAKVRISNNNSNEVVLSGKLPYMAPEQLNSGEIDRRTDIFSLGAVFYELLTGARLFPLKDPEETIDLIKKSKIDTTLLENNNVPQSVQQVLLKMLQKNPENRYHGANGVYLDLVECLMTSTHSVELSDELGKFIHELFDSDNGEFDVPAVATVQTEPAIEEEKSISLPEDQDEISQSTELLEENLKPGTFEIKEPEFHKEILTADGKETEDKPDSLLKDEDDGTAEQIDSVETAAETSEDSIESIAEVDEKASAESIETSQEKETETKDDLPESFLESKIESILGDDQDSELSDALEEIQDQPPEIEPESTKLANPDNEISAEINKIFEPISAAETNDKVVDNQSTTAQSIETQKKPASAQPVPSIYTDEETEDDLKTVIDVIRLSTRRHKKIFTLAGISIVSAIVLFLLFDIMLQITSFGEAIYNRLFPPAIRISSIPSGATVYIDNKPISGKTPLSIPKISPGVHELKLTYAGFNPLIKSVHVPSKGEVKITGEKVRKGYDPYLFQFKSQIDINSDPSGATIYINHLLYPQKTPATIEWEVGQPLSIELEQEGFQKLSGFKLNTLEGIEEIEDRRLWSFNLDEAESKRYVVEGMFKKFITISCIPSAVNFYIDGSPNPSGRTDASNTIALTLGQHEIRFQKNGYNSRTVRLDVTKEGPESISVMLTRNVRFFAKDQNDPGNNEIGATIVRIVQNNRSYERNDRTPCEISLPPVNLQVVLQKDGYKNARVNVSPRDRDVVVKMEPSISEVQIIVKDALTDLPLKDAQVSYRPLSNEQVKEVYFGATDETGTCVNRLAPGEYSFKVKKFGYFEKFSILNTRAGNNKLEFKLIIQ